MFKHIFTGLEARYAKELAIVRQQYPSEPVKFTDKALILHWNEAMALLRSHGVQVDENDDLSSAIELQLGAIVKEKYDADFFILDQYPSRIRPFYTMPSADNTNFSNSYDMFIRGQEICSGAQRCHDVVSSRSVSADSAIMMVRCLGDARATDPR
jgi:aspartyl-tRNA synthetase